MVLLTCHDEFPTECARAAEKTILRKASRDEENAEKGCVSPSGNAGLWPALGGSRDLRNKQREF